MPKPRLIGGKPLMVGGKVALSDDCCCGSGNTGVCCILLDCNPAMTEADCIAAGGTYYGDRTTCGECPDPDAATITITFAGISVCPGFEFDPDPNGTFVLIRYASGKWFGVGNSNDAGLNTINVECPSNVGRLLIQEFDTISQPFFAQDFCIASTVRNGLTDCSSSAGKDGTATLSP